jgi:hypothetical protein
MSQAEQMTNECRAYLDSLPFLRRGMLCFAARRPGRWGNAMHRHCQSTAEVYGFSPAGTPVGERTVRLLDGPATALLGFSWAIQPAKSKREELACVSAQTKNSVAMATVDFVVATFTSDPLPPGTTDAAILAVACHPDTAGQEQLGNWLIDRFATSLHCSRPHLEARKLKGSGGYELLLARYIHGTD